MVETYFEEFAPLFSRAKSMALVRFTLYDLNKKFIVEGNLGEVWNCSRSITLHNCIPADLSEITDEKSKKRLTEQYSKKEVTISFTNAIGNYEILTPPYYNAESDRKKYHEEKRKDFENKNLAQILWDD